MTAQFAGKVALVTGGASGIGRAAALAFGRNGAKVAIADLNATGGEATSQLINNSGGDASFIKCDVSSAAQVEELIERVVASRGRLDCAVNAGGIEGRAAGVTNDTEENFDAVIAVNLRGVWLCLKYEIAQMLKDGGGAIVNLSSVAGIAGSPRSSAYCASKHGVIGLTRSAALEFARSGVRVNAICPGAVDTPMMERIYTQVPRMRVATPAAHPLARMAHPDEIGAAAVWLCSDEASFVTGCAMPVDGGMTAQ
jgi:NAD(P)-dependent dehydrogenase (short-subunit alcohol dehydrogenase family)